jgi:hypothetical protein
MPWYSVRVRRGSKKGKALKKPGNLLQQSVVILSGNLLSATHGIALVERMENCANRRGSRTMSKRK